MDAPTGLSTLALAGMLTLQGNSLSPEIGVAVELLKFASFAGLGIWTVLRVLQNEREDQREKEKIHDELQKINNALFGIEGYGGILNELKDLVESGSGKKQPTHRRYDA